MIFRISISADVFSDAAFARSSSGAMQRKRFKWVQKPLPQSEILPLRPFPSPSIKVHDARGLPAKGKVRAFGMTNNLGPNPQPEILRPYMLAHLHDMTMYLQLPEGGVKTAFPNEISGRDRFVATRWPNGVSCPACGDKSINTLPKRDLFQCRKCRKQFSPTSGTDLHRTRLSVQMWLFAAEAVIQWNAQRYMYGEITLDALGSRLGVHSEAALRVRRIVTRDICVNGTGLLRRAVCLRDAGVPETIQPWTVQHFEWVQERVNPGIGRMLI
jgi:transposase-like protein